MLSSIVCKQQLSVWRTILDYLNIIGNSYTLKNNILNFNISYKDLYMPLARYSGVSNHKYVLPVRVSLLQALQEAGEMSGWTKRPCTALQLQKLETTTHRFPYIQPIFWHIFRYIFTFLIVHALQVPCSIFTGVLQHIYTIVFVRSMLFPFSRAI